MITDTGHNYRSGGQESWKDSICHSLYLIPLFPQSPPLSISISMSFTLSLSHSLSISFTLYFSIPISFSLTHTISFTLSLSPSLSLYFSIPISFSIYLLYLCHGLMDQNLPAQPDVHHVTITPVKSSQKMRLSNFIDIPVENNII